MQCVDDEYTLDGEIFSLDYRTIDGDVSLPQNSFKTADFKPQGTYILNLHVWLMLEILPKMRKVLFN